MDSVYAAPPNFRRKAAVASITGLLLSPCSLSATAQTLDLGFYVRDDAMEPVPNATVLVASGSSGEIFTADSAGAASFATYPANAPLTVVFEEAPTMAAYGAFSAVTIAQQFTLLPADLANFENKSTAYYFHQPMARDLTFNSASTQSVSDAQSGWLVVPHLDPGVDPSSNPPYLFSSWVAELPTTDSISRYFAYYTGTHTTVYQHGVLFRMEEDVNLGTQGFDLIIDTEDYSYGSPANPQVHSIYVGDHPGGNGMVASVEALGTGHILIQVRGELREGDNLVLLSQPDGSGRNWRAVDTDSISFTSHSLPAPGMCQVPPPTTNECNSAGTCVPEMPFNPFATFVICAPATCSPVYWWIGPQVCTPCGQPPIEFIHCLTFGGSVSINITGMAGSWGEIGITAGGEITGQVCVHAAAPAGTCRRVYLCASMCKTDCEVAFGLPPLFGGYFTDAEASCLAEPFTVNSMACTHSACQ